MKAGPPWWDYYPYKEIGRHHCMTDEAIAFGLCILPMLAPVPAALLLIWHPASASATPATHMGNQDGGPGS